MLESEAIRKFYQAPVKTGSIQDALAEKGLRFDHVACFSTMVYLDGEDFAHVLSRMLEVAQKSITFDVEDTPQEYTERMASEYSNAAVAYNHTAAWNTFKLPEGWKVVRQEFGPFYHDSVESGIDFSGTMIRLEKS
ncbi:hypothetical protein F4779DRAFT_610035 [Xylariaceae sp. FL0662B]|nr:hypothetical protein F4779DRAFT_610035 [Xylariaceae sp. FL0662B]